MRATQRGRFGSGLALAVICATAVYAQPEGVTLVAALRTTLEMHPALLAQIEQVNINRGLQQEAAARFERLFDADLIQDRQNSPLQHRERTSLVRDGVPAANTQVLDVARVQLGATRMFRNGVAVDFRAALTRTTDNLFYDGGVSRSATRVVFTVPMAGNRGRPVVAAEETAAGAEVESSLLDVQQTAAGLIANTAIAYWNVMAAKKQLAIAIGSEERGRRFHENIRALIDADRLPQNDLHNVAANLAERTGNRIAAAQTVVDRRRDLALAMGVDARAVAGLPDTVDVLPESVRAVPAELDDARVQCHVDAALRARGDLRASQLRVQAARTRMTAARDLMRPRVDMKLSVGYAGMREGLGLNDYVTALLNGGHGMNAQFGLAYVARSRQFAAGRMLASQAAVRQAELLQHDLDRAIRASIVQGLAAVRTSVARLERAAAAVESFQQALEGHQEKLRLGVASIVELLTVEDRLTNALLKLVDAQLAYPEAIVRLRLATGTLSSPDRPTLPPDADTFFTVPECPTGVAADAPPGRRR